jgi:hypothetical protein
MSAALSDTQLRKALAAARECLEAGHDKAALLLAEALVESHNQSTSVPLLQMCVRLRTPAARQDTARCVRSCGRLREARTRRSRATRLTPARTPLRCTPRSRCADAALAFARSLLTAARRLHELRHVAFAEHLLGVNAFNHGDYAGAAAAHTRAAAALEAVGPPAAPSLPRFLTLVLLPAVLHALGIALKHTDDTARSERAYLQSLAAHETWGDATARICDDAGQPRVQSLRQQNCAHLTSLYSEMRAKTKLAARLRMWRAIMEEEGIACPGDSDSWLQYAQATATTAEEAADIAARARRVYAAGCMLTPAQRAMRFRDALCAASAVLAKLGDTDAAYMLGLEAVADASRAAGPEAWRVQADALTSLADSLRPKDDGQLCYDAATEARRIACLRLYCRAAALFPAPARHGCKYVDLLQVLQSVASSEFYAHGGADVTLPDAELVVNLPISGAVRFSEPHGRGFIELSHGILQAQEALYGAQAPQLAERLGFHAGRCCKYGDAIGAVDFARRHVALCAAAFGARHDVTQEAQAALDHYAHILALLLRKMPANTMASPDASRKVQLEFLTHLKPDYLSGLAERMHDEALAARATRATDAACAAIRGATRPQRFACAACCALPAPGAAAPLQKCAACMAVTYCGPACQHAHWRAHRKDCKLLRKPTTEPPPPAKSQR